jgi:coenzyme F420-dependent glucose-6-phosphate dehydrogenase
VWAESDEQALAGSREWKATLVDDSYTAPIHEPAQIQARGQDVSDTQWKTMGLVSSDPAKHVRKIKAIGQLGATAIVLMNVSGADPHRALQVYGEQVVPELRER